MTTIEQSHEMGAADLGQIEVQGMTRASFVLRGTLAAAALYGAGAVTPFVASAFAEGETGDLEILNFALTLEYLESDFYNVKGKSVGLKGQAKSYAHLFGEQESEHVTGLTAAIKSMGGTPAAKPTFVFPAGDESSFLKLASVLENTGVGAYNGAGPLLKSKAILATAGEIVQVEARHAAAINLLVSESPTPDQGFDRPLTKTEVLAKAGPLIKK
jgi:hypothetical protein